jgi:hypothetical protein
MRKAMARAVASPTCAAWARIFFMRASGAKGLPFSMPIEAKKPSRMGSSDSAGSSCTAWLRSSQNA